MRKIIKYIVRNVPRPLMIRLSYTFSFVAIAFYKGKNVACPICEHTFRKMLPYGNKGWDNRLCPKCLSLERHRLLWLFLKNKTDFFEKPYKVLHVAPEQPFLKRFRRIESLDYITGDLFSPIADVKMDVRNIPFPENEFDIVICNHVMEHIIEEQKAAKEFFRVLKPGAYAILQVPIDYKRTETYEDYSITNRKDREQHFGQYDHVRLYGLDYPERIAKAGFVVEKKDYSQEIGQEKADYYRLDKNEIIYLFYKPK